MHDLKFWILKEVAGSSSAVHKFNLIGRNGIAGPLEWKFGKLVGAEERALAVRAFDELRTADLICPTYADIVDPENWVTVTDAGRQAIQSGALDNLDQALLLISPHLPEIRRGAWSAVASAQPDALRQAAHSGREMIDQALKEGAPDSAVTAAPGFTQRGRKDLRITRRDRLKFLMRKCRADASDSDIAIAQKAIDLVLEIDKKLTGQAHARSNPKRPDIEDCLRMAEDALRRILVGGA